MVVLKNSVEVLELDVVRRYCLVVCSRAGPID